MHYLRSGTEIGSGRIGEEHKMNGIWSASSDTPVDADVVENMEHNVSHSIHLPVHVLLAHTVLVPR